MMTRRLRPLLLIGGVTVLMLAAFGVTTGLPPAGAQGLDEKAQIEQRYENDKLAPRGPKLDPEKARPTSGPRLEPPTGIIETSVAPFPSSEFLATNRWQAVIGDNLVVVLAGGPVDDTQGKLAVLRFSADGVDPIDVRWVDLPGRSGRARVATAQGSVLVIETGSGRRFTFNPALLQLAQLP